MVEFLRTTPAQLVIWTSVLAILIAVGAYVVLLFRREPRSASSSPNEMLTGFRDLHERGQLSPDEFQRVKSVLGEQVSNPTRPDTSGGRERAD